MAKYQSDSFREHHLTRLPILNKLLELGWKREQIICPSPNSTDTEWRIPKTPSEASKRELGRSFNGFPVDIAIFDSVREHGEYEHLQVIIECKAPNKKERTFSKLEKAGYLLVGNYNKDPRDKTKWYTINDKKLEELYLELNQRKQEKEREVLEQVSKSAIPNVLGQNAPMEEGKIKAYLKCKIIHSKGDSGKI